MNLKKRLRKKLFELYLRYGPKEQTMNYLGYKIHYPKGTSLIELILKEENAIYEQEETKLIVQKLKSKATPTIIDIGANIGLMSLNLKKELPNSIIYCIEPGKSQFSYLKKNLNANQIDISIFNIALSDKSEKRKFVIHEPKHSSGDGFIDTGRAGEASTIEVDSIPLDDWWSEQGNPQIDFLKIDTEGAELLVLKGAQRLIEKCSPIILIEICHLNLKVYPYEADDIYNELIKLNYKITTLVNNLEVTISNKNEIFQNHFLFFAENQNAFSQKTEKRRCDSC